MLNFFSFPLKQRMMNTTCAFLLSAVVLGCASNANNSAAKANDSDTKNAPTRSLDNIYVPFTLKADLSHLSARQKRMLGLLIDAAKIMDGLFWQQAYGDKNRFLGGIADPKLKAFAAINYGPWDRLDGNKPFIKGAGEKPLGARFYPEDMTKAEFEKADFPGKKSQYTLVKRGTDQKLTALPYHQAYAAELQKAAGFLRQAARYADDASFKKYLLARAEALVTDEYQNSDRVWLDMKNNPIDIVIGAIENYEDKLFGYRTAFEAYVLVKDMSWSKKLARFAQFLPELQKNLPVEAQYKAEQPGTDSDLNAYDVIYYAGHCNAGSKTIAINLPNDEQVQLEKGTRRLQLKNAMRAKYEKILIPIAKELIDSDQLKHITFNAFFENTMFHEVAHGLGIKNTINNKGTVREALKETASAIEEGKADILGLYMVSELYKKGEIKSGQLMDNYVTFMAGIFRSIRFGAASAHGKANMVRFNYFQEKGAFAKGDNGKYRINPNKFSLAIADLSQDILKIQGDGNYQGAIDLLENKGKIGTALQKDLDSLTAANIPVDIVFEQGKSVLKL